MRHHSGVLLCFLLSCSPHAATGKDKTQKPSDSGSTPAAGATPGGAAPAGACVGTTRFDAYLSDPKLCLFVYAKGVSGARQMAFASNGDLFVNNGQVTVLWDNDRDGDSETDERGVFAEASNLNHGIAFDRKQAFVYASSDTTVFRWPYVRGQRVAKGAAQVVVHGMPGGGHSSRTLVFDAQGRLYVSVGSESNVDGEQQWDTRAQIRRFATNAALPSGGFDYANGTVIAKGMRNEAGLYVDASDRLWGVENGRDDLTDDALGGDIHSDNPGEEINLIDGQGASFYGYPLCFSEHTLAAGQGVGTQWADKTLASALRKTDTFCRDSAQVHPPAFVMPAHWAPLGIVQYTGSLLPFAGDLLIGAHGSWDRQPAVGRLIARAHLEQGKVVSVEPIVGEKDASGRLKQGGWSVRPVDLQQGPDQALYFSDDAGARVFKLGYQP